MSTRKSPKEGFLRLSERCYVFSGNLHWKRQLSGRFPHAPPDYLALLNPENPLRFRLLGYGEHNQAAKTLREALCKAQYLQISTSGRTGVNDVEVGKLRNLLPGLDGTESMLYGEHYIAAALFRERQKREEFIIVVGTVADPNTCLTIRFSELNDDLTFRFMPKLRGGPAAVDFRLQCATASRTHLRTTIYEYANITKDLSLNPWTIRDGAAVYDPRRYSDCREIPFSDGYLARSGEWVISTTFRQNVPYESAKIF